MTQTSAKTRFTANARFAQGARPSIQSLMTVYQAAKKAMKEGKLKTDKGRLNRGLGLSMRTDYDRPYFTGIGNCSCEDCTFRGRRYVCKHQIRWMLTIKALELDIEKELAAQEAAWAATMTAQAIEF